MLGCSIAILACPGIVRADVPKGSTVGWRSGVVHADHPNRLNDQDGDSEYFEGPGRVFAPACPETGSCCAVGYRPGCTDVHCCELVCASDSFCCTGEWDEECVVAGYRLCGDLCRFRPCVGA